MANLGEGIVQSIPLIVLSVSLLTQEMRVVVRGLILFLCSLHSVRETCFPTCTL